MKAGENALFYVFTTFFVVYVTRVLQRPRSLALEAAAVASVTEIVDDLSRRRALRSVGRRIVTAVGFVAAGRLVVRAVSVDGERSTAAVLIAAAVSGSVTA